MRPIRLRSLQLRLAVQLAAVYVIATAVAAALLIHEAYDTAGTLNDRDLDLRAAEFARYVTADPKDGLRLDLPPRLAEAYGSGTTNLFAVRGPDGRLLAASPAGFGDIVAKWPRTSDDLSYFRLRDFGAEPQDYHGVSVNLDTTVGPLSVSVARAAGAEVLASAVLREFANDIAWGIPLLVIVTSGIGVFVIRRGLRPVREISDIAATIGPASTHVRLSPKDLPSEVKPLVAAVNHALDRLEQGFAVQRKFTANAAHELRTPLAIITAALDTMEGNGELTKLKSDVARMNRVVEQLLRVARLDAIALDVSAVVDLKDVAADVVASMAPWAVAQQRTIAFDSSEEPAPVKGNKNAIGDAIRNLIENAIVHSPPQSEVGVNVEPEGRVSIMDHGPGISPEERALIFDRFWRGKGGGSKGAGLGLAIVREIMNAHQGNIIVDAAPNGGTVFTLCFVPDIGAMRRIDAGVPLQ